jgi:hypothetical protein
MMTRQQRRKMERNSNKNQSNKVSIFSTSIVDTKSIIEKKKQIAIVDEDNLEYSLKKNLRIMETIVIVNFKIENQNNIGVLNIIHEYINNLDSNKLINIVLSDILQICSKYKIESILQRDPEIDVLDYQTFDLLFDLTKPIKENIQIRIELAGNELIELDNIILEAA